MLEEPDDQIVRQLLPGEKLQEVDQEALFTVAHLSSLFLLFVAKNGEGRKPLPIPDLL
jgi:hypothetical protein